MLFSRRFLLGFSLLLSLLCFSDVTGYANSIREKNAHFMYRPTFIQELRETHRIVTTISPFKIKKTISRSELESGTVPIQIFRRPRFAPQEILRLAEEKIEVFKESKEAKKLNRRDRARKRIRIREALFKELQSKVDKQVIEGVALAIAKTPASKVMSIFLDLNKYKKYVPDVFEKSVLLTNEELKKRGIIPRKKVLFQFSTARIASVRFSHTIRYVISEEKKKFTKHVPGGKQVVALTCYDVSWEMDQFFKNDISYKQKGVLMNSGRFILQPYVQQDGTVDPARSTMLYHIYIKVDPDNYIVDVLQPLFSESEARSVLNKLASAMRREAE